MEGDIGLDRNIKRVALDYAGRMFAKVADEYGLKKTKKILSGESIYIENIEDYHRVEDADIIRENKTGVFSHYMECRDRMLHNKNIVQDLSEKYEMLRAFGGGKSGAYVFLVRDKKDQKEKVLKLYVLGLNNKIGDRDDREIFTTCTLSGIQGLPIVYDYGKTYFVNGSPFWKQFTDNFIKCVDQRDSLKPHYLLNNAKYLVTSLSPGKTLDSVDLFSFKDHELIAILHQLLVIFSNINKKMPNFIHNDLHPGNIFISSDKDYEVFLKCQDGDVYIKGPKVNIIDFDISITPEQPNNIAKSRQLFGDYLVQEAVMILLTKILGITATAKIIEHTKQIRRSLGAKINDDIRLWYIYKMLIETIIIYRRDTKNQNQNKTIDPISAQKIVDIISADKLCTDFGECIGISYVSKCAFLKSEWKDSTYSDFKKVFSNPNKNTVEVNFENVFDANMLNNIFGQFIGSALSLASSSSENSKIRELIEKIKPKILPIIKKLEIDSHRQTGVHFGLHNFKLDIGLKLRSESQISINILDGKDVHTLKVEPRDTQLNIIIKNKDIIGVILKNLKVDASDIQNIVVDNVDKLASGAFSKVLPFGMGKVLTGLVSPGAKIYSYIANQLINLGLEINMKTGEVGFIDSMIGGFVQKVFELNPQIKKTLSNKIKDAITCDGATQDIETLRDKVIPIVINLLRYLDDVKATDKTILKVSNSEGSIGGEIEFNIREIIDYVLEIIDDVLYEKISLVSGEGKTIARPTREIEDNYKEHSKEKEFIKTNFPELKEINSIQDLSNFLMNIGKNKNIEDKMRGCSSVIEFMLQESHDIMRRLVTSVMDSYGKNTAINNDDKQMIKSIYENITNTDTVEKLFDFLDRSKIIKKEEIDNTVLTYYRDVFPKKILESNYGPGHELNYDKVKQEIECTVSEINKITKSESIQTLTLEGLLAESLKRQITNISREGDNINMNSLGVKVKKAIQTKIMNNIPGDVKDQLKYFMHNIEYMRLAKEISEESQIASNSKNIAEKLYDIAHIDINNIVFHIDITSKSGGSASYLGKEEVIEVIKFMIFIANNAILDMLKSYGNLREEDIRKIIDTMEKMYAIATGPKDYLNIKGSVYGASPKKKSLWYPVELNKLLKEIGIILTDESRNYYYDYVKQENKPEAMQRLEIIDNFKKIFDSKINAYLANDDDKINHSIKDKVVQKGGHNNYNNYDESFKQKYMKYKIKYLELKKKQEKQ